MLCSVSVSSAVGMCLNARCSDLYWLFTAILERVHILNINSDILYILWFAVPYIPPKKFF